MSSFKHLVASVFIVYFVPVESGWKCLPRVLPSTPPPDVIRIPECMLNVRTVIFSKMDTNKPCWSVAEVQLLVTRRVMQNLVPSSIPRNFKMLYRFFERAEHTLRSKLAGPRKVRMFFTAFYDVVGGYIHSVVIPVLNEAFYAGNVDYYTVRNFHLLLGRIMGFLDTNGDGWAGPCDMSKIPTRVTPLPLHICRVEESCKAFVVTPYNRRSDMIGKPGTQHYKTQSLDPLQAKSWNYCAKGFSKIPLPFLDDPGYPGAIAIPLRDHALFSLMSERAVNVIPKYYILAMRCLHSSYFSYSDVVRFNFAFHKWIMKDVIPHLYDLQRWYPGFGGVMRVVETMNKRGLASNEVLPTTNRTPTCNRTFVKLKTSRGFRDNTALYSAIGLAAIGGIVLLIWLMCTTVILLRKGSKADEEVEEQGEGFGGESDFGEDIDDEDALMVNTLVATLYNQQGLPEVNRDQRSYSSLGNVSRSRDKPGIDIQ